MYEETNCDTRNLILIFWIFFLSSVVKIFSSNYKSRSSFLAISLLQTTFTTNFGLQRTDF